MAKKRSRKAKKSGAKRTVVVVGKKHHKPRKRSVSGTHKKKTRKRVSGTMKKISMKQIAIMAVGVGVGAGITHIVLRRVEKHLTDKWPMLGKFMAAGEVFLGGMVALTSKKEFVKSVGIGILAGGVHGLMKQFDVYKEIPKLSGAGDGYSEIRVPISGPMDLDKMLGAILEDSRRNVYTKQVAGLDHTRFVAGNTETVADTVAEDAYDSFVKA